MSLSVSFRRSARAELIEAAARYESERQDLGVEFIAEIERCVAAAAERPMSYSAVYKDIRRVVAKRFPFSVYFRADTPYRRFGCFPWKPGSGGLAAPDLMNNKLAFQIRSHLLCCGCVHRDGSHANFGRR
jgi:hypothetical protein